MNVLVKYRSFSIFLEYGGMEFNGMITPISHPKKQVGLPTEFSVVLNGVFRGIFCLDNSKWQSTYLEDDHLVNEIGKKISNFYE